jgi:hypothetical protein
MKLPLATGFLSGKVFVTGDAAQADRGRYRMRVDRVFDFRAQPWLDTEDLSAESYREGAPSDRWEVAIDGSSVVLTELGAESPSSRLEGIEAWKGDGERRFHVGYGEGYGHAGLFVVRGDEAELTLFAPGYPVVRSERGKLLSL